MRTNEHDSKKIIIVACASEIHRESIARLVKGIINTAQVFFAIDGIDAFHKAQNSPPHILIADVDLLRMSGLKLATTLLSEHQYGHTNIILIGAKPNEASSLEQALANRLQFTPTVEKEEAVTDCINKALAYMAQKKASGEYKLRVLKPGEFLLKEGDKADFVYIVRKGSLVAQHNRGGVITAVGNIEPGEFVGEMAYINGAPRSADVVAVTDAELIQIPVASVDDLLSEKPSWAKALMNTLAKRLRAVISK